MIGVTGATGNLGKLVIKHLLEKTSGSNIVAFARNPEKAEDLKKLGIQVRNADYNKAETWKRALQGVDRLLLISSNEIGNRETQHEAVIEAAKEAGVPFIVYTSILRADFSSLGLSQEHLSTEKMIKKSGLSYTILRNGWYLENHTEHLTAALQFGVIQGAAKEGIFSSATRDDYALAAAIVLTVSGHENKTYELVGDKSFTLRGLASEVSRLSGKGVVYQDLSFEEFKNILVGVGIPEGFANVLSDSDVGASKGDLYSESKDLTNLIGRPTTTLEDAIRKALNKG